ncbi:MAG: DnaJ domain-containing protein [Prosthecobacter sp.]|nr:DnaJ domain-containing protein [Prosthecobacter sp.]
MTPAPHPETQRLLDLIAELRSRLAGLLTQSHDLIHIVRPNLYALYQTKLGPWELEKLKAQFRIARLKRILELSQAALNHGQPPNLEQILDQVDEDLTLWQVKLKEATQKLAQAELRLSHLHTDEHNKDLKKLYYDLVKQLHPDLHPNQDHGSHQLWQQVQDAYEAGDLEKLRALSLLLKDNTPAEGSPDALEQLQAQRTMLENRITELQQKITEIESQPPFTLREDLANEDWITKRRLALEQETEPLKAQADALEKQLQTLHPSPHALGHQFGPN